MARKIRVFLSYDFEHDRAAKGNFAAQAGLQASPFSMVDSSLLETEPEPQWIRKANSLISKSDLFIVLLGRNTHSAPGVLREVSIAKGLGKPRIQVMPQGRQYAPIQDAGEVVVWKWKNIAKVFERVRNAGLRPL